MSRRQGAVSALLIGACSQRTTLRRATANRLGPLAMGSGRPVLSAFDGTSQYGLASVRGRVAPAFDECRSSATPVIDNFSIAPICSWEALIDFNRLRANQTPAIKNAS